MQVLKWSWMTDGAEGKNKLINWIDSDFGSVPVTRKSMTVQLMSLNDDTIFWRSPRQGVVTLSSSDTAFVVVSQAVQVVYLREILEDNVSRIQ